MLDFFFVPYICLAENGIKSFFLQKPYGEIPLFLGRAGKDDLCSTLTQPPSHTEAEPRRAAGHDGDLPLYKNHFLQRSRVCLIAAQDHFRCQVHTKPP